MEILNTYTELKGTSFLLGAPLIIGGLPLLLFILVSFAKKKFENAIGLIIILGLAIFAFKHYVYLIDSGKGEYVYHEVIIKDEQQIDAFKYEIIEQKGKITLIRELDGVKK